MVKQTALLNNSLAKTNFETNTKALMENIIIRQATTEEVAQLQKIGRQTFWETFAAQNTLANMQEYLDTEFSTQKLTAELANPNSQFYFALSDGHIIGYLKLNMGTAQTELQETNAVEIERIYVLKAFHGKKIGQLLYEKAVQLAREQNADYVWLGVWEENKRAISFYKKNGFVAFDKHLFKLGNDVQTDIMMKLPLQV